MLQVRIDEKDVGEVFLQDVSQSGSHRDTFAFVYWVADDASARALRKRRGIVVGAVVDDDDVVEIRSRLVQNRGDRGLFVISGDRDHKASPGSSSEHSRQDQKRRKRDEHHRRRGHYAEFSEGRVARQRESPEADHRRHRGHGNSRSGPR